MDESNIFDYMVEYETFVTNFKKKEVSGEEVGEMIARMASHYGRLNMRLLKALKAFLTVQRDIQSTVDGSTGKAITSSKAEVMAAATPEGTAYTEMKIHVQNSEQYINALKALQKGVLMEYSNAI